ncbi:MAG: helix-turn-helix domain-containing protein, partial [Candidatus Symbiothrix sp.]|nr:helix-turn-helix domain-containing protein [Candidatus Symbiothrix sp.]
KKKFGMSNKIIPLSWHNDLKNKIGFEVSAIDDDFMLFDKIKLLQVNFPFRLDVTVFIICSKGTTRGRIGLRQYETVAPCIITLLADEIMQCEYVSDDFEGMFLVMSKRFTDSLFTNIRAQIPMLHTVRKQSSITVRETDLNLLKNYYSILKYVVEMTENPHRKDIIKHLLLAFYYHSSSWLHSLPEQTLPPTKHDELVGEFLQLAERHFKSERQVGFYAEKLCLTPKYLSQIIKTATGKSANEWIDDYVILEAKALLKSSKLTIQQIANELHFADQSVFGKYFKRMEGVSPKEYREM